MDTGMIIALSWGLLASGLKLAAYLIPGDKDDRIIVKILDIGGNFMSLGLFSKLNTSTRRALALAMLIPFLLVGCANIGCYVTSPPLTWGSCGDEAPEGE